MTRPCQSADYSVDIDTLAARCAAEEDAVSGVVITKDGVYYGYLSVKALLRVVNARRIRRDRDENPLTRLPGKRFISEFVRQCAVRADDRRMLVYVDIEGFQRLNEAFGYDIGDRALLTLATLLRKSCQGSRVVIGHFGGDEFFIGARGDEAPKIAGRVDELAKRFDAAAADFWRTIRQRNAKNCDASHDAEVRVRAALLDIEPGARLDEADLLERIAKLQADARSRSDRIARECVTGDRDAASDAVEPDPASRAITKAGCAADQASSADGPSSS